MADVFQKEVEEVVIKSEEVQMKERRRLDEVIDLIIAELPEDEKTLRDRLTDVKNSYQFRPPEMWRVSWEEAGLAFEERFGNAVPEEPWELKIYSIWMRRPEGDFPAQRQD